MKLKSLAHKLEKNLSYSAKENVINWLSENRYSEYKEELLQLITQENWTELEEAFYKKIDFGTAGRRGVVGVGTNRINNITIRETAQGICDFIVKYKLNKKITIGWDGRNSSKELALNFAKVVVANGIEPIVAKEPCSTPELSYNSFLGNGRTIDVMITASHNTPEYNGIKVYRYGCQINVETAKELIELINNANVLYDDSLSFNDLKNISNDYIKYITVKYKQKVFNNENYKINNLKVIYSPLCGVGKTNVLPILETSLGKENVLLVKEQSIIDGDFSSIENQKPNPEELNANLMAIELLKDSTADIGLTSDPDSDRLAVLVKDHNGEVRMLDGNESALLMADYLLRHSKKGYIAKTIVTTDAITELARLYSCNVYDNFLVGFKYIGETIINNRNDDILAGFEESLGTTIDGALRDKDAAASAIVIVALTEEMKKQNKTLLDRLDDIYRELGGMFYSRTESIEYKGKDGLEKMNIIIDKLKQIKIGEKDNITAISDYETLKRKNADGKETIDMLEPGKMIRLEYGDSSKTISIRPSGTEPKMKIYSRWKISDSTDADLYKKSIKQLKEEIL